jgi:hypothetical protein
MPLQSTYPYIEVHNILYVYPNGDKKIIKFKNPIKVRQKGWEEGWNKEEAQLERLDRIIDNCDEYADYEEEINEDNKQRSLRRSRSKIAHYCHSNKFDMFATLTIAPDKVDDRWDIQEVLNITSKWLELQRKKYGKFDYIIVPEKHPTSGAWHMHCVLGNYKGPITKALTRKGREVYQLTEWQEKLGYTDLEIIQDIGKVSNYIRKYITKDLMYMAGKHKYLCSKGLYTPQAIFNVADHEVELAARYENDFMVSGYFK